MKNDALSADKSPRTISKSAFFWLSMGAIIPMTIVEIILLRVVCSTLGLSFNRGMVGGLGYPNVVLSRVVVDQILKRMGFSRSGTTVEERGRSLPITEEGGGEGDVVEVHIDPSLYRLIMFVSPTIFLMFTLLLIYSPPKRTFDYWMAHAVIFIMGLGSLLLWWTRTWPIARIDAEGVLACPEGLHLRRKFVPWSEVATCEIGTIHNTFGTPVLARPILKDQEGRALLTISLLSTRFQDQQRLIKAIQARLPKVTVDPWE